MSSIEGRLFPYQTGLCEMYSHCSQCTHDASCFWCSNSCKMRLYGNETSCEELPIVTSELCNDCTFETSCADCIRHPSSECVWSEGNCVHSFRTDNGSAISSVDICPSPCLTHKTCTDCLFGEESSNCGYCPSTGECFDLATFIAVHTYGQCQDWVTAINSVTETCHACGSHTTCTGCLEMHGCGWCGHPVSSFPTNLLLVSYRRTNICGHVYALSLLTFLLFYFIFINLWCHYCKDSIVFTVFRVAF